MTKISIDPITRLEGHGRIDLIMDDAGAVQQAYLVIPELRGFEKFAEGRPVEEMPRITARICGVCPEAHSAASVKAAEACYGVKIPPTAELIRRLQYNAFVAGDHATHFYALGGPDFIMGPDADPSVRNIVGVIGKVGLELGGRVIRMRKEAHEVAEMLGGRRVNAVGSLPGGQSHAVTPEMRDRLIEIARYMVEFAEQTIGVFHEVVLGNSSYVELIGSEAYVNRTYYVSLVNERNEVDHYDGMVRVVDPDGNEVVRYDPADYLAHIAERVEPWTYLKLPYLKAIGWKGLVDGPDSGVMRTGPLGMLNAAEGMQTPLAQAEYERMYDTLGGRPVHATLAFHWARLIELMQAAELTLAHATDERLCDPRVREIPTGVPSAGVGTVEAPRGLLTHHYFTDEQGIVQRANMIVGTTHNYPAIQLSVATAARSLVTGPDSLSEPTLNMIEMAFRAYDPCFGCATHALDAAPPLTVRAFAPDGTLLRTVSRSRDGKVVSE